MPTQRQLLRRIAAATGVPAVRIDQILDLFLDELATTLARKGRVSVRNFGTWRVVKLRARTGRNPRTGEPIRIPKSRHVRFRAGKALRRKLNP